MMTPEWDDNEDVELLEIQLLLEGVYRRYGIDFREYSLHSLARRIRHVMRGEGLTSIAGLQEKVLRDKACMRRLLLQLCVNVTSMFRNPEFYRAFRENVVPWLRDLPFIRLWHTGCATGEEVYSMAILLEEENLYDRCRIYATDINEGVLRVAKSGIYSNDSIEAYSNNYLEAGGNGSLAQYYHAKYGHAIVRSSLKENIVFALHNLVTDSVFNEFHVIICRNVLIYFNKGLQEKVHNLLYSSLTPSGVLGLGPKETIALTPFEQSYQVIDAEHRLYRKVG